MTHSSLLPFVAVVVAACGSAAPAVRAPAKPTVAFFEIASADVPRAARFYEGVFGWSPVAPVDASGAIYRDGMITTVPRHRGGGSTVIYVGVEHLRRAYDSALAAGAESVLAPRPIPGKGSFAVVLDLDNNRLGLFSTEPSP